MPIKMAIILERERMRNTMANRINLNQTSYHGAGAIEEIANEAKAHGFNKAFVCSDPDLIKFHVTSKVTDILDKNGVRAQKDNDIESRYSERLEPVISYIKENYAYEITLGELAAILPMSEGQFSRVFKQTMKLSPIQYLMRYRILQSCKLLQDTEKKIGEIANLSGFNNISYFNRVFLNTIGCTPKEYRENSSY